MRTPRSALRNDGGSARSPSAIWTRTRSGPGGAGRGRGSGRALRRRSAGAPARCRRGRWRRSAGARLDTMSGRPSPSQRAKETTLHGIRHRGALHRHEGQLVCRGVPVDGTHPTTDEPDYDKVEMLYIDPEECIDCNACVEACPVDACFAEPAPRGVGAATRRSTATTSPRASSPNCSRRRACAPVL